MRLNILEGDATNPTEALNAAPDTVIMHVCNDIGAWGSGFVVAISRRWSWPEKAYRAMESYTLGEVQLVGVEDNLYVANIIGQHGTISSPRGDGPPVRYDAIRNGLIALRGRLLRAKSNVVMPRMGCGLAGGSWAAVEALVMEELVDHGIEVFVYDFPGGSFNP